MFYNFKMDIYNLEDSKIDENHIYNEGTYVLTESGKLCDVQPYSSERLKRDYGYDIVVNKRIFCDIDYNLKLENMNETIKENTKLIVDGITLYVKKYLIWDNYVEIFCSDIL